MDEELSDDGGVAYAKSSSKAAGAPTATQPSHIRAALTVVALAVGFALIPRATQGCEGISTDADAPNFTARIVANADNVGPRPGALGAAAAAGGSASPTEPAPVVDETSTSLELSSLRGRPVILDFWATWCGPCQAEAPIVNTIAQRYKDRGLAVVGVNTSDEEGLAAAFVRRRGLGFPIVYDQGNAIAKQYNVTNLPTLVIVSKTGKIVAIRHGVTSDAALDDLVRRYL